MAAEKIAHGTGPRRIHVSSWSNNGNGSQPDVMSTGTPRRGTDLIERMVVELAAGSLSATACNLLRRRVGSSRAVSVRHGRPQQASAYNCERNSMDVILYTSRK